MADQYAQTFCVTCKQKTLWSGQPTLKQTRNRKAGLRGTCNKCNKTKFTFVTACYYQSKRSELMTQQKNVVPATQITECNKN